MDTRNGYITFFIYIHQLSPHSYSYTRRRLGGPTWRDRRMSYEDFPYAAAEVARLVDVDDPPPKARLGIMTRAGTQQGSPNHSTGMNGCVRQRLDTGKEGLAQRAGG